jgi:hypothetical protein
LPTPAARKEQRAQPGQLTGAEPRRYLGRRRRRYRFRPFSR